MPRLLKCTFLISFLLSFCSISVLAIAQEEISITTYYPSPNGSYNELGTNKLAVDINGVAVPTEFAAMANGDAHIGRSLIIGAGGGSGFAYDEVATAPADGTLLVKGRLGIGTTNPSGKLHIRDASANAQLYIGEGTGSDQYAIMEWNNNNDYLALRTQGGGDQLYLDKVGKVGIGTSNPSYKLEVAAANFGMQSRTNGSANAFAIRSTVTNTGTSNYGLLSEVTGAGTTNYGLYLDVSGATNNYAIYSANANARNQFIGPVSIGSGGFAPGYPLTVTGPAALSTGTAWTQTSDRRWKDVQGGLKGNSLDKILALRPISYTWNDIHDQQFGKSPGLKYGFIAQDVEGILPDMISKDNKGYYWYNPSGMEAILTAAIQEQQDIIKTQQLEIDELKARLGKLEEKQTQAEK